MSARPVLALSKRRVGDRRPIRPAPAHVLHRALAIGNVTVEPVSLRKRLRYGCSYYARRGWWAVAVPV